MHKFWGKQQGFTNLITGIVAAVAVVAGLGYYGLVHYAAPRLLQEAGPQLGQMAQEYINGEVKVGSIAWNGGLTVAARQVQVLDKEGQLLAQVPQLAVAVNPLKALWNRDHAISTITLENPVVYLTRDAQDKWNFQNFLKPSQSDKTPFYGTVDVRKGLLYVQTPEGKWDFGVNGKVDAATNPNFALGVVVTGYGDTVKVDGVVNKETVGNLYIKAPHVALGPYAAWAKKYGQVENLKGTIAAVDLHWQNDGDQVDLSGTGVLDKLAGTYPLQGRQVPVDLSGNINFEKNYLALNRMQIGVDGQKLSLNGHLDYKDREKLQGYALVETPSFTWEGETVTNVKLPVDVVDSKILVNQARFDYGGGKIAINGSYEPKSGAVLAIADMNQVAITRGQFAQKPLTLAGSFGVQGTASKDKVNVNVVANTLQLTWQQIVMQVLDFDADITKDGYKLTNFSARAGAQGNLALSGAGTFAGALDFKGRLSDFPLAPFLAAAGQDGSGYASGDFKVSGTKDNLNFDGMTQLQQLQYGKVQIAEAHGLLHMRDSILDIHDYQVHMGGGTHVVNGTLNLQGSAPLADLTVRTEKVRAESLVAATGKDIQLTGNVDNEVHLVGSLDHPHVNGTVALTDGSAYGYLVDKAAGTYAYDDGALKLDNFVVNALSTTVTLNGTMDRAQNLDFAAQADNVDLEKLPVKDEQVALTGFVSAQGTLKGTLQQPLFSGKVKSKTFTVNGQEIDSLDGSLITNGKDINKLVATAEQKSTDSFSGLYAFDMNLNAPAQVLQGTINVSYGKLQSLMKMAKLDYDVDGEVTGSLDINRNGPGTGGEFHASVDNLRVHKLVYHQLLIDGHIKNKVVHIDDAHLEEKEGQPDKGFIAMGGDIDFGRRTLKLELGGRDANPAIITAVMKDPVEMTGTMNMAMQLSGSFDNPVGNASVEIDNGTVANVSVDKAVAMLSLKDDNVKLEQILLNRTQYKLSAYGNLPVDLFRAAENRRDPNAQMNIKVNLDDAGLGILSAVKGVDWAVGPTQGTVVVSGTLEEPLLNGKIAVSDGALKLKNVNTLIDKLNLDVQFAGNRVFINNISATLGKGTVAGSGTYALRSTAKDAYHFTLQAKNADLDANIFKGRINADVAVSPQSYRVNRRAVGSEKEIFGYRPFVKADIRLDDVLINMPTVPSFGDSDSNIGLDVNVTLGPKVHLFNKYLYNMWLKGGLHIGGSTRYKIATGSMEAVNGTVTYLRTIFKLNKAEARWTVPGTILPHVEVEAATKFNRYRIQLKIGGDLSGDLVTELISDPPLSKSAIMRMLTLQRVSAGSDEVTGADLQNMLTAGLETALLGDVEQFIRQTFGIDQFRVYMGRLNSGVDIDASKTRDLTPEERSQYNFLVGKNLTDRLSVGYTASFNGQYNNLYTQYAVSDHINFTAARDQDSRKKVSLEYRISF